MKRILLILLFISFTISTVSAKTNEMIRFNGTKYYLKYSAKSPENNGYINEYFKQGESPEIWSEMIAVHHFPNVYSPIDQTKTFQKYLNTINCPSAIEIDEDKNKGMIDFILINAKRLPIILEFNIFKYEKDKNCGTKAVQFAKRYCVTNSLQVDLVKKEFDKSRNKLIKEVNKFRTPALINTEISNDITNLNTETEIEEVILETETIENLTSDEKLPESNHEPEQEKETIEAENQQAEESLIEPKKPETAENVETKIEEDCSEIDTSEKN